MNRAELVKVIAEKMKTAGNTTTGSRAGRSEFAELLVEIIQPNHLSLDLFQAFLPVVTMNPGDQRVRKIRRGRYPVRTMVPGSKHLTDVLSNAEQYTYVFDRLIAGTSHSLWEIQSGEVGTVEQMRTELRQDLFDELVSKVFTLLGSVWTTANTPNNYIDATSGGVTATALDTMIENVLDQVGTVRAIVGSRKALLPVYKFAQFKEFVLGGTGNNPDRVAVPVTEAFNEFNNTRRVTTYTGIPLVELPNVYRNSLVPNTNSGFKQRLIATNRIVVVGDQAGEIALMGGTDYQDYTDPTTQPPNYVLHCWQAYGMIVDQPEGIGIIDVGNNG